MSIQYKQFLHDFLAHEMIIVKYIVCLQIISKGKKIRFTCFVKYDIFYSSYIRVSYWSNIRNRSDYVNHNSCDSAEVYKLQKESTEDKWRVSEVDYT